jgi:diguanylate cyclase (GGDEF)-like protein
VRILLFFLLMAEAVSVLLPRLSNPGWVEINFVPQLLIGFVVLVLIFTLHLASQSKLLSEVSTALIGARSYLNELEQLVLIDAPTQLFNRRFIDHLFKQQSKWLNRRGETATLLLIEVLPNGEAKAAAEIFIGAAFILRSNFRGSDYVLRFFTDQFLVLLPDTNEQQAQSALSRLIEKVDHWNCVNPKCEMALRLGLATCPPDGNLWDKLNELEEKMQDKSHPDCRLLISYKRQVRIFL